ncbi:MAG: hypothetical protein PVG49_00400 [Desulfobacteraceae bacterium]
METLYRTRGCFALYGRFVRRVNGFQVKAMLKNREFFLKAPGAA